MCHVEYNYSFLAPLFFALRDEGHEVIAACNLDHDGRQVRRYVGEGFHLHQIRAARAVTPSALTMDIFRLAAYLRRERFDVVHVHGPLLSMQARIASWIAGVPIVVYQAHGFYWHDEMRRLPRLTVGALEWVFGRLLTDYLVTVNVEDHEYAVRRRFRCDPTQIIQVPGVGIDPVRFRPVGDDTAARRSRDEIRSAVGLPSDGVVVTFVGRLVAEKGVVELLEAFRHVAARVPRTQLWLVGEVQDSERDQRTGEWLRAQLAARGFAAVVAFGRRDDVDVLLRASDIFVLPSHREGMPVALLEAMATGLPVVATDVRGCREAVQPGCSGILVPPRSARALVEALSGLVEHPQLRSQMGTEARARVLTRYTTVHSVERYLQLYRRIGRDLSGRHTATGQGGGRRGKSAWRTVGWQWGTFGLTPRPWRNGVRSNLD